MGTIKNLKVLIFICGTSISLLGLCVTSFAQGTQTHQDSCHLIDKIRPPQYISYDHVEELNPPYRNSVKQNVWLSLYNNTNCTIVMLAVETPPEGRYQLEKQTDGRVIPKFTPNIPSDAPSEGAPVMLAYSIQDKQMRKAPLAATFMHVVFTVRLLPSRSITFGVPINYFKKGYHIVMPFNYEFELNEHNKMPGYETQVFHHVYFFSDNLPKDLLRTLGK